MEIWVLITIGAAFFQAIRTATQKNLKLNLSTNAVCFARFFYGLPWAILYFGFLLYYLEIDIPKAGLSFWLNCTIGGAFQIIGTSLLVYLFSFKNFMVGTTYAKTEAIQIALFGTLLFIEPISYMGFIAIITGLVGIIIISLGKHKLSFTSLITDITHKNALIGLGVGACFAISTLQLRQASISLESDSLITQAAMTLVVTIAIQTFALGVYLALKEKEQWPKMFTEYKKAGLVGFTSVLGSACWFTAFTLVTAAYVKTVGQIEMVFTILISLLIFKEKIRINEYIGMGFIILSILILLY